MIRCGTRRGYLKASGIVGVGLLAGCTGGDDGDSSAGNGGEDGGAVQSTPQSEDSWRAFHYNGSNTGYNPATSGPDQKPSIQWEFGDRDREDAPAIGRITPAVVDGTVFAVGWTPDSAVVLALDTSTGEEKWRYESENRSFWSPVVLSDTVYVCGEYDYMVALDAADGAELWRFELLGNKVRSPTVLNDTVLVSGFGSNHIVALDATTGSQKWKTTTHGGTETSPAVGGNTVYVFGDTIRALDISDGSERWQIVSKPGNEHYDSIDGRMAGGSLAVNDGTVYGCSAHGTIYALDAADGSLQWTYKTAGGSSSPTVADETVYTGIYENVSWSDEEIDDVYALDKSTGEKKWTFSISETVNSAPAIAKDVLYLSSSEALYAVDSSDGNQRWKVDVDLTSKTPAVVGKSVYVTGNGKVYSLAR